MIHPSMIMAMLSNPEANTTTSRTANNNNNSSNINGDMQRAQRALENVIEKAAVVTLDQEAAAGEGENNAADGNRASEEKQQIIISGPHWVWIGLQFMYSMFAIFAGFYCSCDDIDTLRAWSVMWGLAILFTHVVIPVRGWDADEKNVGTHLLLTFALLYVWGGSAIFPHWNSIEEEDCDDFFFWFSAWAVICGMGCYFLIIAAGLLTSCCQQKCNQRAPSAR